MTVQFSGTFTYDPVEAVKRGGAGFNAKMVMLQRQIERHTNDAIEVTLVHEQQRKPGALYGLKFDLFVIRNNDPKAKCKEAILGRGTMANTQRHTPLQALNNMIHGCTDKTFADTAFRLARAMRWGSETYIPPSLVVNYDTTPDEAIQAEAEEGISAIERFLRDIPPGTFGN